MGGRKAGTPNQSTLTVIRQGSEIVKVASQRIQQILNGKLPCSVCRGKGMTKYQPKGPTGETHERTCQSCYGSKYETLSPELIGKVALEVRAEAYPKLKAIEFSNPDGSLRPAWVVVKPGEAKP